ncbi:hypothetical protein PI125_g5930 [Phytophthora idaei]|nr:hypothetical protein PI125_g5930 [Phytophthora idaei]
MAETPGRSAMSLGGLQRCYCWSELLSPMAVASLAERAAGGASLLVRIAAKCRKAKEDAPVPLSLG